MDIQVLLCPVHRTDGEVHRIKWVDNVVDREVALIMKPGAIGMLVRGVEILALGQIRSVSYRDVTVLIHIRTRQWFDVVTENVLDIANRISILLSAVGIQITHQRRTVAIAVAIHRRQSKHLSCAVHVFFAVVILL